jgi:hypothetical protein
MSESVLFIIGAFVFAITIYGAVMAGGLMLTRVELTEEPDLTEPGTGLPFNRKY